MSRRNSQKNKQIRREQRETKAERNRRIQLEQELKNAPVSKPDEYILHEGHIPNIPFFYNCAFAVNRPEMKVALRTKAQIIDYFENNPEKQSVCSKVGNAVARINFLYEEGLDGYIRDGLGRTCWKPTYNENKTSLSPIKKQNKTQLYQVCKLTVMGSKHSENQTQIINPFYHPMNSFFVELDDLEKLPEQRATEEELVYFAKKDEYNTPMDDDELEEFFSQTDELYLKESYEHKNGQIILDEIPVKDSEMVLYQPKKTYQTWAGCVFNDPVIIHNKGWAIVTPNDLMEMAKKQEATTH